MAGYSAHDARPKFRRSFRKFCFARRFGHRRLSVVPPTEFVKDIIVGHCHEFEGTPPIRSFHLLHFNVFSYFDRIEDNSPPLSNSVLAEDVRISAILLNSTQRLI